MSKILVCDLKLSYEGEGDWLGKKTAFFRYPGNVEFNPFHYWDRVAAYYCVTDQIDEAFIHAMGGYPTTVECGVDAFCGARKVSGFRYFVCVDELVPEPIGSSGREDVTVKIRILSLGSFWERLQIANAYGESGHLVLLMPEFKMEPVALGELMMNAFDKIHPNVRLMPPVHHLLEIP